MELSNLNFDEAIRRLPDFTPCDSPIEDIFYTDIQKRVADGFTISRQVECPTRIGTFYLDFLIEVQGRRVGFECDGKNFHDSVRDSARDAAIIAVSRVHRIFRLRGYDICFHLHDALDLIRIREQALFSERGHANIEALASRFAEHRDEFYRPSSGFPFAAVRWYEKPEDEDGYSSEDEDDEKFKRPTVVCWTGA